MRLWKRSAPIERCTSWLRVTLILPISGSPTSNLCVVSCCYFPERKTRLKEFKNLFFQYRLLCLDTEYEKQSAYVEYKQVKYLIQKKNANLQRMEGGKWPKNKTILIAARTRGDIRDYQEQAQFNPCESERRMCFCDVSLAPRCWAIKLRLSKYCISETK